jgi:serine/threonine-protein kinase
LDSTAGERPAPTLLAGKYRLEREVGRGGMGVVFQATHTALRLRVAIKIVLPELAQNPLVIQRLLREARCAAQITGDHVVRVIDVGQLDSGQPFIVMEYVEGEDLARRLAHSGRLTPHAAVHALLEACIAIAEAHAKGIVHRDLKPSNLFLARAADGRELIKVLDFGISKQADGERPVTRPNDVMGSPNYMAPEQICAPLAVDARADLWALGAILVELATGKRAFPGDTITAVYTRVLTGEPDLPEPDSAELPKELLSVVSRCLKKDPNERFQNVHELVAALAPFAPPASDRALRAIARFERTALEGSDSGETATSVPSPFASAPPSSRPSARSIVARSPGWVVAGVGLGLALSAAVAVSVAPEAWGLGWGHWHGWRAVIRAGRVANSEPLSATHTAAPGSTAPARAELETPPSTAAAALPEPAGTPSAIIAEAGEPAVRVLAAVEAGAMSAHEPPASEPRFEADPRPAEKGTGPRPAAEETEPRGAAEVELRRAPTPERARAAGAPPPEAPLRNPWDVTTFGGRS